MLKTAHYRPSIPDYLQIAENIHQGSFLYSNIVNIKYKIYILVISEHMRLLVGKEREIGIISIISIIVCSNSLLYYIQNITAEDLKKERI